MPPTNQMQKQRVKITTVDPQQRIVEGTIKDGVTIRVAVFEVPPTFRWPVQDEIWTIYRENQFWVLGGRVHGDETYQVEDMDAGELRLDSAIIKDALGNRVLTAPLDIPVLEAAPEDPELGEVYYDSVLSQLMIYLSTGWEPVGGSSGGGDDVDPVPTPPGDWQLLAPYLNPKWSTPAYYSITDLTDEFCPRFYLDRDRIWFGGIVTLDDTISSPNRGDLIFWQLPAPYTTHRQQHFPVFADGYWSSSFSGNARPTSWSDTAFFWSPSGLPRKTGLYLTNYTLPPNGTAISLDGISYRIT